MSMLHKDVRDLMRDAIQDSPVLNILRNARSWHVRRQWKPFKDLPSGEAVTVHITNIEVHHGPTVNGKQVFIVTGKVA